MQEPHAPRSAFGTVHSIHSIPVSASEANLRSNAQQQAEKSLLTAENSVDFLEGYMDRDVGAGGDTETAFLDVRNQGQVPTVDSATDEGVHGSVDTAMHASPPQGAAFPFLYFHDVDSGPTCCSSGRCVMQRMHACMLN
jgi:hypothetical protein